MFEPKEKPRKPNPVSKKRKANNEPTEEPGQIVKAARIGSPVATDTSVRRSSRNAGKKIDYNAELKRDDPPRKFSSTLTENEGPQGRESGIRKHDP